MAEKKQEGPSPALISHYQSQAAMFFVFRVFAGLYQNVTREAYLEAVGGMMKMFEDNMKMSVKVHCDKVQMELGVRPGVESPVVRRMRIEHHEAIANVVEFTKQYLISLNVAPDSPSKPQDSSAPESPSKPTENSESSEATKIG